MVFFTTVVYVGDESHTEEPNMKISETKQKRTFTLSDISEEEMDMLRYFAATRAARTPLVTTADAALRFLKMTENMASDTLKPEVCFK